MALHRFARPLPPAYSEKRTIETTLSPHPGSINIYFYMPKGYQQRKAEQKYPLLVHFHGGGFTLGCATDDCRWFGAVLETIDAIIATVDYRLAPEYPFPTAVDDGTDAILWLVSQASKMGIDLDAGITISGFSAGGNLAFTVPLKLYEIGAVLPISAIVSWYPPTNYTITRTERNKTNPRPDLGLPDYLTSLFDQSYIYPPEYAHDVLVSPALATDIQLIDALPRDIWIYTCEYDDLCDEGKKFAERLRDLGQHRSHEETPGQTTSLSQLGRENELHKYVRYTMIEGVQHAWDKAPNPLWINEIARAWYKHAVEDLRATWIPQPKSP